MSGFLLVSVAASFQTKVVENSETIENSFFTLDFKNNDYSIADIERHFFTTFPHDDPTHGDVIYDRKKWQNDGMIKLQNREGLYLYVKGREDTVRFDSFRLTSKAFYNLKEETPKMLFVFKGQLPSGKGIWPAWWLNGSTQEKWTYKDSSDTATDSGLDHYSGKGHFYDTPSAVNSTDWPSSGELDIIENINGQKLIYNTLHTCPQMCDSEWNDDGKIINCANAKAGDPNSGCSGEAYEIDSPQGTFACLWEKDRIKFYYWTADEDVRYEGGPLSADPNPDLWSGKNLKNKVQLLETDNSCNNASHGDWQCKSCEGSNHCLFRNMKMIFNITLCGSWAGNLFDETPNALNNCKEFIFGEGKSIINDQFFKIEYVAVKKIGG